jgi:hypothetical protein
MRSSSLDGSVLVKPVHLVEQLQQNALHLAVCAGLGVEPEANEIQEQQHDVLREY